MSSFNFDYTDPLCYFGPLLEHYPSAFRFCDEWLPTHFQPSHELIALGGYQQALIERLGAADPSIYEKAAWLLLSNFGAWCSGPFEPYARGFLRPCLRLSAEGLEGTTYQELWDSLRERIHVATELILHAKRDVLLVQNYLAEGTSYITHGRFSVTTAKDAVEEERGLEWRHKILLSLGWARWLIVDPKPA